MAKKGRPVTPRMRRKALKRPARLQAAKAWLPGYTGKNLVRGYMGRYGVDFTCALKELELLGAPVDAGYVARRQAAMEGEAAAKRKREALAGLAASMEADCDDRFAFIAGWTSGGFPYGITWEEWRAGVGTDGPWETPPEPPEEEREPWEELLESLPPPPRDRRRRPRSR
jgi:hypothetical protein